MELDSLAALNFLAIHEQWWDHCSASIHDCHISVHQLDYWIRERFQILNVKKRSGKYLPLITWNWRWKTLKWIHLKLDWLNSTLILPISKRNHICVKKRRVVYWRLMTSTYQRWQITKNHLGTYFISILGTFNKIWNWTISKQGRELESSTDHCSNQVVVEKKSLRSFIYLSAYTPTVLATIKHSSAVLFH